MKVIVGMSGGVDSSVAALKMVEKGYDVTGLFMKNWEDDDLGQCQSEKDYNDALLVCKRLNIPLETINFSKEYMEKVFKVCLTQFQNGATPNPDILCNQEIKFKCFLEHALSMGADYIATGHYAQINKIDNKYQLLKSFDDNKDQTYFLYTLTQDNLAKIIFPLGDIDKSAVREIAKQYKMPNHNKKDSTGICFIGERNFKEFLSTYLLKEPGDIVDTDGKAIGRHDGLMYYTLGQRSGINIGGLKGYPELPWYVLHKDLKKNILMIGQDQTHPLLNKTSLTCQKIHWIDDAPPVERNISAKIRYRQLDQACTISLSSNSSPLVTFNNPQRAITLGQSIVFYKDDICLGGAIIQG